MLQDQRDRNCTKLTSCNLSRYSQLLLGRINESFTIFSKDKSTITQKTSSPDCGQNMFGKKSAALDTNLSTFFPSKCKRQRRNCRSLDILLADSCRQ